MLTPKKSQWVKPFINFNTEIEKKAKNSFERNFFMVMNNIVYRKMMKNLRNRVDVRFVTNAKDYQKLGKKHNFCFLKDIQ